MPADDLPVAEFAFPGPLRDQLVAAILAGEKTTTSGLVSKDLPSARSSMKGTRTTTEKVS
jgi:hypothetical protein